MANLGRKALRDRGVMFTVIASSVPALAPTLMDETNAAVIARLDRATQYSRDRRVKPRSRGVLDRPVKPGDDSLVVAGVLPSPVSS